MSLHESPKKPNLLPRRSTLSTSNTDTKLTRVAIHYEYLFEWGVNFKDRVIVISDEIDSNTFDIIEAAMTEMESEDKSTITVKINSPGGSVYDALAIVGRLKNSKCHIVTEGYGCIMSAATLILACGDRRRVSNFSWFMHHEASYEVEGRHSAVKNYVKQAEREEQQWARVMAEFTEKPEDFWAKEGVHVDAYFTAEQLLEMGVVDEVF